MGICDSSNNNNINQSLSKCENHFKKFKKLESSDLEQNSQKKTNSNSSINNKISTPNIKFNICPQLQKYKPSFEKKSESNLFPTRSEYSSIITEEEIIIKGEINKKCQNKERDFNNNSFKRLIKNNGGIILKEDTQSNKQSNNINDISKENISEIYSQFSFGANNKGKNSKINEINGKKNKEKLPSETYLSRCISHHSISLGSSTSNRNNDNKSFYSNKTNSNKINLNNYLNDVSNNNDNLINNNIQYRNNYLYYLNRRSANNPVYNSYNNIFACEKESLLSNVNNVTNESTNEEMSSFISIPKNDERIPESDLNLGHNIEDIFSNISSRK